MDIHGTCYALLMLLGNMYFTKSIFKCTGKVMYAVMRMGESEYMICIMWSKPVKGYLAWPIKELYNLTKTYTWSFQCWQHSVVKIHAILNFSGIKYPGSNHTVLWLVILVTITPCELSNRNPPPLARISVLHDLSSYNPSQSPVGSN